MTIGAAGTTRQADGTVRPAVFFTFDWLRLSKRPVNGLAVTLADGSPLPDTIKTGDTLAFEVLLEKPALDVVVSLLGGSAYTPIALNGQPHIPLSRADREGRVWTARTTIGSGTPAFQLQGYPLVFRARITGGPLRETRASAFVSIKP